MFLLLSRVVVLFVVCAVVYFVFLAFPLLPADFLRVVAGLGWSFSY